MKISKQARRDAKQLFVACQTNGVLDAAKVSRTVQLVAQQKPRGHMGILHHLQRLVKLDLDRRSARIESAVALAPEQQSGIQANLTRVYGAGLQVAFVQNPALIGGLRIKVGSDVYDASVASRLARLRDSFEV